jgi:hypothetical protein
VPASLVRFTPNAEGIAVLLHRPEGPVMRRMAVDAEKVRQEAIRLAPRSKGRGGGTLRSHIVKRLGVFNSRDCYFVGVPDSVPYAIYVSRGTAPHVIYGNPLLAFFWAKTGRTMFLRKVNHPGTKPNPYLQNALKVLHY